MVGFCPACGYNIEADRPIESVRGKGYRWCAAEALQEAA